MASIASISGIASGIQWQDLIDRIMQLEARPIRLLESKIERIETRSDAWSEFRTRVEAFRDAAEPLADGSIFQRFRTTLSGFTESVGAPLGATAEAGAVAGSYTVRVLGIATREKLGGAVFASRTNALGIAGEFRVNGARIAIEATDSLDDIAEAVNAAGAGVTASVLATGSEAYRLVLTSEATGAAGIELVDGAAGVLRGLGLLDGSTTVKHRTSNGARSDGFTDATTALSTLLGLEAPPAASAVSVGGVAVTLDLATMSLNDVAAAINAAAAAAGSAVTAAVVEETLDGGAVQRLEIENAGSFTDANRILEALGILEGGRGAVAQQIRGAALTAAGGAPATAATSFAQLDAGVTAGDSLTVTGTRADGSSFTLTYAITDPATQTVGDFLAALNDVSAFGGGSRTATASIDASGRIVVTDDTGGDSRLALAVYAGNEGGGTLDPGEFTTVTIGREREIVAGADAAIEIDGTYLTRSDNVIEDAVPGLTLNLLRADRDTPVEITVARDTEGLAEAVHALVDGYNAVVDFVKEQATPPAEGESPRPLSGESTLRLMRARLRDMMETRISGVDTGEPARLADIGIEVDRDGRYTIDDEALTAAIEADAGAVARLFGVSGTTSTGVLEDVRAGDGVAAGTYDVEITQVATRAEAMGGSGPYVDDGVADTLSVTDLAANRTYTVPLSNGMTVQQVADALNAAFGTAELRASIEGGRLVLRHDAYGSAAGFEVAYAAGGADGTASLGLAAGTYRGTDVQGTIGGHAATGAGQFLFGDDGTAVDSLSVRYTGSTTGAVGSITILRGAASAALLVAGDLLGTGSGSIPSVIDGLDASVQRIEDRIADAEARLDQRREQLAREFAAMETALARAQSQAQWLTSQLAQL